MPCDEARLAFDAALTFPQLKNAHTRGYVARYILKQQADAAGFTKSATVALWMIDVLMRLRSADAQSSGPVHVPDEHRAAHAAQVLRGENPTSSVPPPDATPAHALQDDVASTAGLLPDVQPASAPPPADSFEDDDVIDDECAASWAHVGDQSIVITEASVHHGGDIVAWDDFLGLFLKWPPVVYGHGCPLSAVDGIRRRGLWDPYLRFVRRSDLPCLMGSRFMLPVTSMGSIQPAANFTLKKQHLVALRLNKDAPPPTTGAVVLFVDRVGTMDPALVMGGTYFFGEGRQPWEWLLPTSVGLQVLQGRIFRWTKMCNRDVLQVVYVHPRAMALGLVATVLGVLASRGGAERSLNLLFTKDRTRMAGLEARVLLTFV